MQHYFFWVHATGPFPSACCSTAQELRRGGVVQSETNKLGLCVHHGTTYKAHRCKRRHAARDRVFDCFDCGAENHFAPGAPVGPRGPRWAPGVLMPSVSCESPDRVEEFTCGWHFTSFKLKKKTEKQTRRCSLQVSCRTPPPPFLVFFLGVSDGAEALSSFASRDCRWPVTS